MQLERGDEPLSPRPLMCWFISLPGSLLYHCRKNWPSRCPLIHMKLFLHLWLTHVLKLFTQWVMIMLLFKFTSVKILAFLEITSLVTLICISICRWLSHTHHLNPNCSWWWESASIKARYPSSRNLIIVPSTVRTSNLLHPSMSQKEDHIPALQAIVRLRDCHDLPLKLFDEWKPKRMKKNAFGLVIVDGHTWIDVSRVDIHAWVCTSSTTLINVNRRNAGCAHGVRGLIDLKRIYTDYVFPVYLSWVRYKSCWWALRHHSQED